jgi:hypothetical protein
MSKSKEVFFHVGMGKVASKFLQYHVFTKLKGIYYIQRTKYRHYPKIIANTSYSKYLVSNEFDRQMEEATQKIADNFPDAKIIIFLRRHDSWMASQYRRRVKNGRAYDFDEFFDIDNDKGIWKQKDLYFFDKLQFLEKTFKSKPLVLFHEELKNHPYKTIDRIAKYLGATYNKKDINLKAKHTSYNLKQLKFMKMLSPYLFRQTFKYSNIFFLRKLQRFYRMIFRYLVLYIAYIVPNAWIPKNDLIPKESLEKIRAHYKDDWKKCKEYAEKNNNV